MNLAQVQRLHRRGLSVFPVSNDTKTPMIAWGRLQTARPTPAEVVSWFSENGRSLGVAMGPVSGLLLVDFDFAKGPEALVFFQSYKWPRTWTERTKSGGLHLYFRWTPTLDARKTNTTGLLAKHVDTKGAGGYSKMAPSAGYRWIRPPHLTPLAEPPAWLLDMLPERERQVLVGGTNWLKELVTRGLQPGSRNNDLIRLAGSLRARGYEPEEIKFFLSGPASAAHVAENELDTICKSAGRYSSGGLEGDITRIEAFLALEERVDWICSPWFARRSLGFVAGLPETMKTWVMMDLAITTAAGGGQWCNRFQASAARVLFIDQERSKGETRRRFEGLIKGKGLKPSELDLFLRSGPAVRFDEPMSFERFKKELSQIQPTLIIIDSFATVHSSDENNRSAIQAVLERVKDIRNEFGATVIFIDHENKLAFSDKDDKVAPSAIRMAGSIGKLAAAEFCLTVRRQENRQPFVYHTKSTLAKMAAPFMVDVKDGPDGQITVEAV